LASLDAGDAAIPELQATLEELRVGRAGLLEGVRPDRLPATDRDRTAELDAAIAAGAELPAAWADATSAAGLPVLFLRTSGRHDEALARAVQQGRRGEFDGAVATLADADAALEDLRAVRRNANERELDVTTLDELLARTAVHDASLRRLYQLLVESNGVMTPAAERARADEEAARRLLPDTTDNQVIITSDLGGGDATSAVIRIERARRDIDAAFPGVD
jgi:hypothetical protein